MVDNLFAKALTEGWYHRGSKIAWMTLFVAYLELYISSFFLVACYATLHPALSVSPLVRPSVRPLVHPSHFTFFCFCGLWPHCTCPNNEVT